MSISPEALTDIGEYGIHALLEQLLNDSEHRNVGDDCALLPLSNSEVLLINVDRLALNVEGYNRARLGVAQVLSDIICMGGRPEVFLVALTLPRDFTGSGFRDLIVSLREELASYGCRLIGGDTKEGSSFHMVGVGIGRASPSRLVQRVGAQPGMLVGVTSTGRRKWGLRWANAVIRELALDISTELRDICQRADTAIQLPVAESTAAIDTGLIRAGLDLSDGVGGGARILVRSSSIGIDFDADALRSLVDARLGDVATALGLPLESFALSPGYDWENMFIFSRQDAQRLQQAVADVGGRLTVIGHTTSSADIRIGGANIPVDRVPADEKFAKGYTWSERFDAWRRNCESIFGRRTYII